MIRQLGICMFCLFLAADSADAQRMSRRRRSDDHSQEGRALQVQTRYYTIQTDLSEAQLLELGVARRLDAMADEYRRRTHVLGDATDDRRLLLIVCSSDEQYIAAGGMRGSSGCFTGDKLFVNAGIEWNAGTWKVIQHEAFHQYVRSKLGSNTPAWVNEGLCNYFEESIYTGDSFVSGIMPKARIKRLQESIRQKRYVSVSELIGISRKQWNANITAANYDMSWSLVHFLAHADGGKYQNAFLSYILASSSGRDPRTVFEQEIGAPLEVEAAWADYYSRLSKQDMDRPLAEAAVRTVTGFAGRIAARRSALGSFEELLARATRYELPQPVGQEVPIRLLLDCFDWSKALGEWALHPQTRSGPHVTLKLDNTTTISGRYTVRLGQLENIDCWVQQNTQVKESQPATSRPSKNRK